MHEYPDGSQLHKKSFRFQYAGFIHSLFFPKRQELEQYIKWSPDVETGNGIISVYNPATGEHIADYSGVTENGVKQAVEKAGKAQPGWAGLSFQKRAEHILKVRDALIEKKEVMLDILQADTGKSRQDALTEIISVCEVIDYYAKNAKKHLKDRFCTPGLMMKGKKSWVSYHPLGVCGVISPWNFPLVLSYSDVFTALMAGNAVILKPSSETPLPAIGLFRIMEEAGFPKDVFQVIIAKGAMGSVLADHVDIIAFTGSTPTGKLIAERAAKRLIPCLLELGGKDPFIVLKDADLERTANAAVWGSLFNSGQVCMSAERIYVEKEIFGAFVPLVVEKVKSLRQGPSKDYEMEIGSMTSPSQVDLVEAHIADAVEKGATLVCGGRRKASAKKGLFFEPTVLTCVNHTMKVMKEETFGPVVAIQEVKTPEEAISLANDSPYGLGASIWTKDRIKGKVLAKRIESGFVCINEMMANYFVMELPFGGIKESGLGVRHGKEGIRQFCRTQSLLADRFGLSREIAWYPYSAKTGSLINRIIRLLYGRGMARFRRKEF